MNLPFAAGRDARSRARPDHGQATVELALVLPIAFALLVLLFQVALVARDEILVTHAARDAARTASLVHDPAQVVAAARRTLPGADVEIVHRGRVGEPVEVAISFVSHTNLPLVGVFLPDLTLHGRSVMTVEHP
ncbi:MAG TPA: TadE family protein [Acidimicrobiia bacterium]|jgi:hypothetical protein|nr:TadE family protein [Acidimicrobiia bacterium]